MTVNIIHRESSVGPLALKSLQDKQFSEPRKMAVNGHFAAAGQNGTANFEHGIQVIDEDKEFKYDNDLREDAHC